MSREMLRRREAIKLLVTLCALLGVTRFLFLKGTDEDTSQGWKTIHVYVGTTQVEQIGNWQSHAQCGQDEVIRAMFPTPGFFVDLAANHWQKDSNSYSLETYDGWNGICVEANPKYWEGHLHRRCTLVSAVVTDKSNDIVLFNFRDGYGGIVAEGLDNANVSHTLQNKFFSVTPSEVFVRASLPRVVDYMSLDVEGAEYLIFSSLPFQKHVFNVLTIERPSSALLAELVRHEYVEVGVLGHFGDTCFLRRSMPDFLKVLRVGQESITKYTFPSSSDSSSDRFSLVPKRITRQHKNIATGVRCPFHLLKHCGTDLLPYDAEYEHVNLRLAKFENTGGIYYP